MAKIKSWFDCDLQKAVQVQALNGNVFSMDNNGNQICVRIFDGGEKAVISATVTARCILADGSTVNLNGSLTSVKSQSVAVVDIPQSVLLIPGTLKISVQLTASSVVATIAAIITTVYATKTDNVITPSSQVISDWNAEISSQLASAVKFSSQSLSDAQKEQARTNIGAASDAALSEETTNRTAADAELKSAFTDVSGVVCLQFVSGYYLNKTVGETVNSITSSSSYVCAIAECAPGDVITVNIRGAADARAWAYLDSAYKVISNSASNLRITDARIPVAPEGAAYITVNNRLSTVPNGYYARKGLYVSYQREEIDAEIEEQKTRIDTDEGILSANGFVDVPFVIEGTGRIDYEDGTIIASAAYSHTDYVDLSMFSKIKYKRINNSTTENLKNGTAFYDENKNYIAGIGLLRTASTEQYDLYETNIPLNAKFARFTTITNTESAGVFTLQGISKINEASEIEIARTDKVTGTIVLPILPGYYVGMGTETTSIDIVNDLRMHVTRVHSLVQCKPGDIFTVNGIGVLSFRAWGFYDANYNKLETEEPNINVTDKVIIAPPSSAWLIVNSSNRGTRSYSGRFISEKLPDYYNESNYIDSRIAEIASHYNNVGLNGDQFIWITDMHLWRDTPNVTENGLQSAKLMRYIMNMTGISKCFFGGDSVSGNAMTKANAIFMMERFRQYMSLVGDESYMIYGNHEWNNPGGSSAQEVNELTKQECYALFPKYKERQFGGLSANGDYWIDNVQQKIRYFFLNCTAGAGMFATSIRWLGSELENVPSGYTVVILSHVGISSQALSSSFVIVAQLMDAAKAHTSVTITLQSVVYTYDYSSTNFDVACAITGHVHYDYNVETDGGIQVICTTCDRAANSSSGDLMKEVRKLGTIGEQAFDVVQIDKTNRKIYMTRIGGSSIGASYDDETGKIYDTEAGTGTEYTGAEWIMHSPYKDREFDY